MEILEEGLRKTDRNLLFFERGVIKDNIDLLLELDNTKIYSYSDLDKKSTAEQVEIYISSIIQILIQLINGEEIKTCKCSFFPLRGMVEIALKGEIGAKYIFLITDNKDGRKVIDLDLVRRLANMIVNKTL